MKKKLKIILMMLTFCSLGHVFGQEYIVRITTPGILVVGGDQMGRSYKVLNGSTVLDSFYMGGEYGSREHVAILTTSQPITSIEINYFITRPPEYFSLYYCNLAETIPISAADQNCFQQTYTNGACDVIVSLFKEDSVLDQPMNDSFCPDDGLSFDAVNCPNNSYEWYYNIDSAGTFINTNVVTTGTETVNIPFGTILPDNYIGPVRLRAKISNGDGFLYDSNIISFTTLPCTPDITNHTPINASCGVNNGGFRLTFEEAVDQEMAFFLYQGGIDPVGSTQEFVSGNTFTWPQNKGLGPGTYNLEYQLFPGTAIAYTTPIVIGRTPRVTFSATKDADVKCFGENIGQITISADGGNDTYQYKVNGGPWTNFSNPTNQVLSNLSRGDYTIEVRDTDDCVGETSVGNTAQNIFVDGPTSGVSFSNIQPQPVTFRGGSDGSISIRVTGGTPPYRYRWSNGLTTKDIPGLSAGFYRLRVLDAHDCEFFSPNIEVTEPDALGVTVRINQEISCANSDDGILEAFPSGGTPSGGYTYLWTKVGDPAFSRTSKIINGLSFGTYNVTVSNSGAPSMSNGETLQNPTPVQFSTPNITNVLCFGERTGAIRFTISGGKAPYTITWDSGQIQNTSGPVELSNQPQGDYNFEIVDNKGCRAPNITPITIDQEDDILIEEFGLGAQGPTSVGGNNGAIDIEVTGGAEGYTYAWTSAEFAGTRTTQDISGLTEGEYTVLVTDVNGCPKPRTFELKDPEPLIASISVDQNILCFGQKGGLTAMAEGGIINASQGYSYQWYIVESGVPRELTDETDQTIVGLDAGTYEVTVTDSVGESDTSNRSSFTEPPEIVLGGTHVDILCNGGNNGSIDLTAIGGTGILTYSWSKDGDPLFENTNQDLNDLTSGSYTVEVRDDNTVCLKKKTFVVTQPDNPLEITGFSQENVKIFGESTGSISITVSGGTPNYVYSWTMLEDPTFTSSQEGLTEIKAGNYTVEIKDANADITPSNSGCMTSKSFEITQPAKLEVGITIETPLDCNGFVNGVLQANVIGGIDDQPYTYSWFEIIDTQEINITVNPFFAFAENLDSGMYKVIVEDVNGAKAEDIFIFEEPKRIIASLVNKTDVKCFDESTGVIEISIIGGVPFDDDTYYVKLNKDETLYMEGFYLPDNIVFENLPIGIYEIEVEDKNLCAAFSVPEPIQIMQPDAKLEISEFEVVDLTGFETQNGKIEVTISGGTPGYKYEWRRENEVDIIGTENIIDNLPIGNYEVTIIDANDCQVDAAYPLIQPDKLEVTIDHPSIGGQVSCNGREDAILEATVTGGVPFDQNTTYPYYTYQWYNANDLDTIIGDTDTLQKIGQGSYRVIITDANDNSVTSELFLVEEPDVIEINVIEIIDVQCFNEATGSIIVEVTGGTPFEDGEYLYSWGNIDTKNLSNAYAGNYVLTVTDSNRCNTTSEIITIGEINPLAISDVTRVNPSSDNAMDGRVVIRVINGSPPYTYQWFDENDNVLSSTTNILEGVGTGNYFVTIIDANGCAIDKRNIDDPVSELSVDLVQINPVACRGSNTASLRANVQGGIPFSIGNPFTYRWFEVGNPNPIGSGKVLYELPIGSYYIVVEDAIGSTTQSEVYEIEGPPVKLEITLEADYVNCGDGNDWSIVSTISGGVQPYAFFWENGFGNDQNLVNVSSGTYTLIIQDARGCIARRSITTVEPTPLEAEIFGTDPLCYQESTGTARVEPTGGVPPYTYLWSTDAVTSDIVDIPEGEYFVAIMDSKGCAITKEITLVDPDEILLDIGPERKILCQGQTYSVDASINDPNATYKWTSDKGFESSDAEVILSEEANYEIEITTGLGCIARANLTIVVRESPLIAEFLLSSDVFINETFVLANVSYPAADRIEWFLPDEAQIINIDDTYAEIQFSEKGEYDVSMTVYLDGCEDTFSEKIIVRDRSVSSENDAGNFLNNFTIYPIPSDGDFTVEIGFKEVVPISFNIYGVVSNAPVLATAYKADGASEYAIPMNLKGQNIPPGVYFIVLEIPGKRYIHKIIIE